MESFGTCLRSAVYRKNRKQRVRVESSTSEWLHLKRGVPQGSVLGPVLFNLFVNDLYAAINTCDMYNYADGNTISACCDSKQQVIDTLVAESITAMKWFEANMMQADPDQFQAILLKEPSDSRTTLTVGNTTVTTDESVELLGVHLYRHMDFNKQIKEYCRNSTSYSALRDTSTKRDQWPSSGLSSCPTSIIAPWCGISVVLQTPRN